MSDAWQRDAYEDTRGLRHMHFHYLEHFCMCFSLHLHSDQLEFNSRNHQKDKVNIQLVQSYQRIEGCPPENKPSMRGIYVF